MTSAPYSDKWVILSVHPLKIVDSYPEISSLSVLQKRYFVIQKVFNELLTWVDSILSNFSECKLPLA